MATFSTKPERAYNFRLPNMSSKISKKKAPQFLKTRLGSVLGIILLCFFVGFGGGWLGAKEYGQNARTVANSTAAKQQFVSNESELISSIAKNVGQSVVSVDVKTQVTGQDVFGFNQTQNQEAAGTGFILSSDGIVVTNRHVVPSGTTNVSVTLSDGTHFDDVDVVGRTSSSSSQDVAFLKINDLKGKNLIPVTLADSSKVQVGDRVVAIGNALGQFQNTVTSGIISGFGRDVTAGDQSGAQSSENLTDLFQTDAAINEGNSGGPLVNINGEVIGINTAVASGAQNIGFAQPINDVKGLIVSVLGDGKLEQPYLGVRYVSLTNDLAKEFNLKTTRGAYITSGSGQDAVVDGSPADKAGLLDHDVITKVNNLNVDDKTSLTAALSRFKVGDKVTLTIVRDGKSITKVATLEAAPQQ
jgi:serine protease Do